MDDLNEHFSAKLGAIALRMRQLVAMRIAARAASVGLFVAIVLLVVRSLGFGEPVNIALAGSCAAILAAALLFAFEKLPSTSNAARHADQKLNARERFSSAHDAGAARADNVVTRALLTDVQNDARTLVAKDIVPFSALRLSVPVILLGAAAALAANVLPAPASKIEIASSVGQGIETPLEAVERAVLAEDISRVAAFMKSQAEFRNDSYATAVARTLEDLAMRVATGEPITHAQASAELASLRDYAVAATSEWRGRAGERVPELLDALVDRVDLPKQMAAPEVEPAQPESGNTELPQQAQSNQQQSMPSAASAPGAPDQSGTDSDFEQMMADAEASIPMAGEESEYGDNGKPAPRVGSYLDVARAQNEAALAMAGSELGENAEVIGPSSNAQAGDSILAGEGTDSITGGPMTAAPLQFETTAEIKLEATDTGEGQRIEKEIAPPSQRSIVADPTDRTAINGWTRQTETSVVRSTIGATERDLVSAYRLGLRAETEQ